MRLDKATGEQARELLLAFTDRIAEGDEFAPGAVAVDEDQHRPHARRQVVRAGGDFIEALRRFVED